jgi:hypothetical protein
MYHLVDNQYDSPEGENYCITVERMRLSDGEHLDIDTSDPKIIVQLQMALLDMLSRITLVANYTNDDGEVEEFPFANLKKQPQADTRGLFDDYVTSMGESSDTVSSTKK